MDPQEYDRIADLLMQIRKKYNKLPMEDKRLKQSILEHIDVLLQMNDTCGVFDAKGLL
jgi:hypothetical protein